MSALRQAVLASLVSGTTLGARRLSELTDPDGMDELAAAFDSDPASLAQGLDARAHQLATPSPEDWQLSRETLEIAVPLADRLGLSDQRAMLEDASFRVLDPQNYADLVGLADSEDAQLLNRLLADTERLLAERGIPGVVTGRVKSLYSVHRKMERKGVGYAQIYDRVALRVQVTDEGACYDVMEALHAMFEPIEGEYDDYIAQPKSNGYRSLHTAVNAGEGSAEFQVRTFAMHRQAEEGQAAHWKYKLTA